MEAVKVQYTVRPDFAATNKANIERVMQALRAINSPDIKYSAFVQEDGKTFVHFVMRANAASQATLSNLPEFQQFQQALFASEPEVPPKAENLNLVAAGWDVF